MGSDRLKKVNDLIRDDVAKILRSHMDLEGVLVTVTSASVSPTLEHATIFISVLPEERTEATLKAIKKEIYQLQQNLNKVVAFRPVPKIRFEKDITEEHAARIEKLLDDVITNEDEYEEIEE